MNCGPLDPDQRCGNCNNDKKGCSFVDRKPKKMGKGKKKEESEVGYESSHQSSPEPSQMSFPELSPNSPSPSSPPRKKLRSSQFPTCASTKNVASMSQQDSEVEVTSSKSSLKPSLRAVKSKLSLDFVQYCDLSF